MNNTMKNHITLSLFLVTAPNILIGMEQSVKRNSLSPEIVRSIVPSAVGISTYLSKNSSTHAYKCELDTYTVSIEGKKRKNKKKCEDRSISVLDFVKGKDFFAVLDGHGGDAVAEYVKNHLHLKLVELLDKNMSLEDALRQTFLSIDDDLKVMYEEKGIADGSTASVVVVDKVANKAYIAHVGDSRVIICRKGKPEFVTKDHKASDETEQKAAIDRGGMLWGNTITGLKVTRSLGDFGSGYPGTPGNKKYTEKVISAYSDISSFQLQDGDTIILASDGLWDDVSNDTAAKTTADKKSAKDIVEALEDCVYDYFRGVKLKTDDDVSIIVVGINEVHEK